MRVLLAGGITGGHAYPLAGAASFLGDNTDFEVFWYGIPGKIEEKLAYELGCFFVPASFSRFDRRFWFSLTREVAKLKRLDVDVTLIAGAYLSIPAIFAAKSGSLWVYNADPSLGLANKLGMWLGGRLISPFGNYLGADIASDFSSYYFKRRFKPYLKIEKFLREDDKKVLIVGGSQGAEVLCRLAVDLKKFAPLVKFKIFLIAGKHFDKFVEFEDEELQIADYIEGVSHYFGKFDCVISRAGAGTVFQLIDSAQPAILVPLATSRMGHQFRNAEMMGEGGVIIKEEEISKISRVLESLMYIFSNRAIMMEKLQAIRKELGVIPAKEGLNRWLAIIS